MREDILKLADAFLSEHYPGIAGVLLYGSAIKPDAAFNDIDLLLIDEQAAYFNSQTSRFGETKMSIVKVPAHELLGLLASDFPQGTYKDILETGIILKDELGVLRFAKQLVTGSYPATDSIIRAQYFALSEKISDTYNRLVKSGSGKLESFLLVSDLLRSFMEYTALNEAKFHFKTVKHLVRYMAQYQPRVLEELQSLQNSFLRDEFQLFVSKLTAWKNRVIYIPNSYSNDYVNDNVEDATYVCLLKNIDRVSAAELSQLLQSGGLLNFYTYTIDENHFQEAGTYIVINEKENIGCPKLKKLLTSAFSNKGIMCPYNEYLFQPAIFFGGPSNANAVRQFSIGFQAVKYNYNDFEKIAHLVLRLLKELQVEQEQFKTFCFYQTFNRDHSCNYKEISEIAEEERRKLETRVAQYITEADAPPADTVSGFSVPPQISVFTLSLKLRFIDHVLNMCHLSDEEKKWISYIAPLLKH